MIALLKSVRIEQWLKNIFVFAGLIFSPQLFTFDLFTRVVLMAATFTLASSSVYLFNDLFDQESDRTHPIKKFRPLASGELSPHVAIYACIILCLASLLLAYRDSVNGLILITLYFLLNAAYTLSLKKIVIIDVFCIAAGFMLRILAGTIGVGISPSSWLLLCGLFMTLFLGFAKRRAELMQIEGSSIDVRQVLTNYSKEFLDQLIGISATGVIITYTLYTMSYETIAIYHSPYLIFTAPFVIYAIFRYLFLLHKRGLGERPSTDLFKDPHIRISVLSWLLLLSYFAIQSMRLTA